MLNFPQLMYIGGPGGGPGLGRDGRSHHHPRPHRPQIMEYFEASGPDDDCATVPEVVKKGNPVEDSEKWCAEVTTFVFAF